MLKHFLDLLRQLGKVKLFLGDILKDHQRPLFNRFTSLAYIIISADHFETHAAHF